MATRAYSPRGTPLGSTQRVLPQASLASSASRVGAGPSAVGGVASRVQQTRVNTQMPAVTPQKRTPDDEAPSTPGLHGLAAVAQIEEAEPQRGGSVMSGQESSSVRPSTESQPEERSVEDQIRGERLWWSENTSLQVRKMSFQMQQELEKATAAIRDQFREQLDIERQHRQAIFGEVKKELSSQRVALTEVESRGEHEDSVALAPHMTAIADCLNEANNVREEVLRSSAQLRQELESQQASQGAVLTEVAAERERQELRVSSLEAALADIRRDLIMQQAVVDNLRQDVSAHADLRHSLAAQQAALSDLRRDFGAGAEIRRTEQEATERHMDELDGRVKKLTSSISQIEAKFTSECTSIRNSLQNGQDRLEESQRHLASVASEAANSRPLDVSKSRIEMLEAQLSEIQGDVVGRFSEVEAVREELNRFAQQLSDEKVERARAIAGVCEHAEEVVQHGLNVHRSKDESPSGGKQLQSLAKKLEAEIIERTQLAAVVADVRGAVLDVLRVAEEEKERSAQQQRASAEEAEDVRRATEEAKASNVQGINQVNSRLSDLAAVVDRLQSLHAADVAELRAHLDEAVSRTQSLAADGAPVEATQELTQALTSLRTALEEEREKSTAVRNLFLDGGGKRSQELQSFLSKDRGDDAGGQTPSSRDLNESELVTQIRSLGTSLQEELGKRLDLVSAELLKRIEQVESDIGDELLKRLEKVESSSSPSSMRETNERFHLVETNAKNIEYRVEQLEAGTSVREDLSDGGRSGRQGAQEQMSEILQLTQIITAGTEKLAERIASESAMWRSSKLQSEARFNYIEKIIGGLTGDGSHISEPDVPASEPELPPLMSEDLKDTLETLVSKLNKTLKPVEAEAPQTQRLSVERQTSLGVSPGPTLGLNPAAMSQGLRAPSRERSTSRGPTLPTEFTRRSVSPGRATSTELRSFVRGNSPTFIPTAGPQRLSSIPPNNQQRDQLSTSLSNTASSANREPRATGSSITTSAHGNSVSVGPATGPAPAAAKHVGVRIEAHTPAHAPTGFRVSGVAGSHPHNAAHNSPANSASSGPSGSGHSRGVMTPKLRHSGASGR